MQEAVKYANIAHKGSKISNYLTLSIGVTKLIVTPMNNPADLIIEADKALYDAKRNGRNRFNVQA
ncbi:diguanylate cyclase [Metabacillus sp. KUDC1714]|uniref:Diguanylate cyclase n=1 Tax=Metabacillus elymi TaxID=2745198 RepID=A0ABX6SGG5_9BACI|nr:diguanylate cyclase [Metabacillus sp. KUDC1714]